LPSYAVLAAHGGPRQPACPLCGHACDDNAHALSCPAVPNPSGLETACDSMMSSNAAGITFAAVADGPGATRALLSRAAVQSLRYSQRRWHDRCDLVAAAESLLPPIGPETPAFLASEVRTSLCDILWPCAACGATDCSCRLESRAMASANAAPSIFFQRLHHGASRFRFRGHSPVAPPPASPGRHLSTVAEIAEIAEMAEIDDSSHMPRSRSADL
jgi:hypothetical protein